LSSTAQIATIPEREYNVRAQIADTSAYFTRWTEAGEQARQSTRHLPDLRYGNAPAETLDFFPATRAGAPLLIFIHGGYWRAFDKSDFSWIAPAYLQAGAAVAVINYGLAPATPLETIVEQARRACLWLHAEAHRLGVDQKRIVCAGHSAGAHLTAMVMIESQPQLGEGLLAGAITISAIADLVPLVPLQFLKQDLLLDIERARSLSPVRHRPAIRAPLLAAVGQLESGEFHRQTQLLVEAWSDALPCRTLDVAGTDHLSVCEAFATVGHELFDATCAMLSASAAT
jgi:arylformamidase